MASGIGLMVLEKIGKDGDRARMGGDIRIDARSWAEYMLRDAAEVRAYQGMVRDCGCTVNLRRALRALRDSVSLLTIAPVEEAARAVTDDDAVTRMLV